VSTRVGELEYVFTANTDPVKKGVSEVDAIRKDLTGKKTELPLSVDTKKILLALREVGASADDLPGFFDDAKREIDKALDAAARSGELSADDIEKAHKNAAEQLQEAYDDALGQVREESQRTGDAVDKNTGDGVGRAGAAVGEFKSEAVANISEVASSFRGDMTSAVDLVQGTLGGLAAAIPGWGLLIAGVGAAIGAVFSGASASAEETNARVTSLSDDLIASQRRVASESLISDNVKTLVQDAGKLANAQAAAKESGASLGDVLRALAGDVDAAKRVTGAYDDLLAPHTQRIKALGEELTTNKDLTVDQVETLRNQITAERDTIDSLEAARATYGLAATDLATATGAQQAYNAAMDASADKAYGASTRVDALVTSISEVHSGEFDIKYLNYAETYRYLQDTQAIIRNITGDHGFRIATGAGGSGGQVVGTAMGRIVLPMAAGGVLSPMEPLATKVPPGTWRVVGDRTDVPEAYIPLDGSARSRALLTEANRLMPMADGSIVNANPGGLSDRLIIEGTLDLGGGLVGQMRGIAKAEATSAVRRAVR